MKQNQLDYIKDFLKEHQKKEEIRKFLEGLPINVKEKTVLEELHCNSRYPVTPIKVAAYDLNYSDRYIKKLHKTSLTKTLPYFKELFHKALSSSSRLS